MKINVLKEDFEMLFKANDFNNKLLKLISNFLNYDSQLINKKVIDEFKKEMNLSNEDAYKYILCSFLEEQDNYQTDYKNYVFNKVQVLNPKEYFNNPYYQNIKIENQKIGNWELKELYYEPYESFIYKETEVNDIDYFRSFPSLGCFNKKIYYPAVLENGREWMTITPNEIETMKQPLKIINGNVITFGLGLGYFAYMASLKDEVKKVTIIEKDKQVIDLFKKIILPQFNKKEKIEIIECDAFDYLEKMNDGMFDYAFVDIWHDVSDGLMLYMDFKQHELKFNKTLFLYWIEKEILIMLRSILIRLLYEQINDIDSLSVISSNAKVDQIYKSLFLLLKDYNINSYYDLFKILNDDGLRLVASKIK